MVVFATKVTHGAWIAVAAMIVLFIAMRSINRYYTRVTVEVAADDEELQTLPSRVHALVLVSRLHRPAMHALALARGMRPDVISAVTLAVDADETRLLRQEWESRGDPGAADHARGALPGPDPAADQLRQGPAPRATRAP